MEVETCVVAFHPIPLVMVKVENVLEDEERMVDVELL